MDKIDKKLLTIIQKDFPICSKPYQKIGEKLGIDEKEVLERIGELKGKGIIRRIGGVFDSRKLGYKSTLCAIEVPSHKIDEVVALVNKYVGVTHNYLRPHQYNLWFTLITPSKAKLEEIMLEIEQQSGFKVYSLPATRLFKIKVNFSVPGAEGAKEIV